MAEKRKWAENIVTDLDKFNKLYPEMSDPKWDEWNNLILWVDDKIVPGAMQMNCCWFTKVPEEQTYFQHQHDVPEIIGLFGGDYKNPHDMGAEIEFWMEDEKYTITKSVMIFVPAGVKHCPLILKRVDRPIFHFTVVTSALYKMTKPAK
jgi:hypothetical protein